MNTLLKPLTALLFLSHLGLPSVSHAEKLYFDVNFDDGSVPIGKQSPIWQIPAKFSDIYGPGNNFKLNDKISHSGNYSLEVTYAGRNGMCNLCGVNSVNQKTGLDSSPFFVAESGEDLTLAPFSAAPGRFIINATNGYSKWEIIRIESDKTKNDKLIVKPLANGINNEKPQFNSGDKVLIARQCGVDGAIGGVINRRSDCNSLITQLLKVDPQLPGTSIYRRVYLKHLTPGPGIHQKFRYWWLAEKNGTLVLSGDSRKPDGKMRPFVAGLQNFNGSGTKFDAGLTLKRDTWYYIEEEFKAATPTSKKDPKTGKTIYNKDGEYRAWIVEAGKEAPVGSTKDIPSVERTGLTLPPMDRTSLWGNVQHMVHARGSWFMDDIRVSDTRNGPALKNVFLRNDIAPPGSPKTTP